MVRLLSSEAEGRSFREEGSANVVFTIAHGPATKTIATNREARPDRLLFYSRSNLPLVRLWGDRDRV